MLNDYEFKRVTVSALCNLICRSGWKRSRDGSWVKDENAEFDSDEDAPDL